jgi:hypothetical protein
MQILCLYGDFPLDAVAIASKLAPLNWLLIGSALVCSYLSYRASPWLPYSLAILAALVIYNNWFVGVIGTDYSLWNTSLASAAFLFPLSLAFTREARELRQNPDKRWWLTPTRWPAQVQMRLKVLNKDYERKIKSDPIEFQIETFDISDGGAFIPFSLTPVSLTKKHRGASFSSNLTNLAVGTLCYVSLPLSGLSYIQCRAEIVRNAPQRGKYPAGIGIRFLGLSWHEKKLLRTYLREVAPTVN